MAPETQAAPYRSRLLAMASPLMVSFLLRETFALVDTAYASMLPHGEADIAAIGLTSPYRLLLVASWVGTSSGLTAQLAAAMGAGDSERIAKLRGASLRIISALMVVFLGLAAWIWFQAVPEGRDPILHQEFRIYACVLLGGMAVTSLWSILPDSFVKAHQDMKSTMWAGILAGFSNVALNTLFLFVFHWGIFGIALGTVLARIFSLVYAWRRYRFHENKRLGQAMGAAASSAQHSAPKSSVSHGASQKAPLRAILSIALPAGLTFCLMAFETKIIYAILESMDESVAALAAWSIFDQGVRFLAMPTIAASAAMLPLIANLWGQRKLQEIQIELKAARKGILLYTLVIVAPIAWLLGPWVATQLSENEMARGYMELGLRWVPLAVLAIGPAFLFRAAFEGLQLPRRPLVIAILRSFALVIPLTWAGTRWAVDAGFSQMSGAYAGFLLGTAISSLALDLWMRSSVASQSTGSAPVSAGGQT